MKMTIDVTSRADGDAIRRAIADPIVKAATLVSGVLLDLPAEDRRNVLHFVGVVLASTAEEETRPRHPRAEALRLQDGASGSNGSGTATTGD